MKSTVSIILLSILMVTVGLVAGYALGRVKSNFNATLVPSSHSPEAYEASLRGHRAAYEAIKSETISMARGAVESTNLMIYTEALLADRTLAIYASQNHELMVSTLRGKITKFVEAYEAGPFDVFMSRRAVQSLYTRLKGEVQSPGEKTSGEVQSE